MVKFAKHCELTRCLLFSNRYDRKIMGQNSLVSEPMRDATPEPTCQFGASLDWISLNNESATVPPIVKKCVEFLSTPAHLETEGIFRRSANVAHVKAIKAKVNAGEDIQFDDMTDVHFVAVLLKTFFREMPEPILTFDLFEDVMRFQDLPTEARASFMKNTLRKKLPEHNFLVLNYLVNFMSMVSI